MRPDRPTRAVAALVATAETVTARVVWSVTTGLLEPANAPGLDRFWRNASVLTAHGSPAGRLRAIGDAVINGAWPSITFLDDPLAVTLDAQAQHAVKAGLLKQPELKGIYDLSTLNKVLEAEAKAAIDDAGLGVK